jgi:hypothetical protein
MAAPVNVVPLAAQEPAVPIDEPQIGNLQQREISILRSACRDKDEESSSTVARILSVAALIMGIALGFVNGGILGFAVGVATYFLAGNVLHQTYHNLRNRPYLEAGKALYTRSFKEYIAAHAVVPTIDNIVDIHTAYKKFATAQAQQLQAAPVH